MTNHEPKHPPADMAGLDGLIERLRKEDEWTNQRPYFHAHTKSLEAATQLQALKAENERLRRALNLAANRLERNAVDYIAAGDPHSYEQSEWVEEARRAALEGTSHE